MNNNDKVNSKYRLPFALCKKYDIAIQDWWTPKDAWNALERGGDISSVNNEYKKHYINKNEEREKRAVREYLGERNEQLRSKIHNPDKSYKHQKGAIAGVKKGKPMTFEQADNGNCNPYFNSGINGYKINCQTCVATYFARRLGYDVRALPNSDNDSITRLMYNPSLAYIDKNGNHPSIQYKPLGIAVSEFVDEAVKENGIYAFGFEYGKKGYSHIMTVERRRGEVFFYDPQNDSEFTIEEMLSHYKDMVLPCLMDITNCTLDEEFCDKIMKRR